MCPWRKELAGTAVPFSKGYMVLFQRNSVVETPVKDHRVSKINSNPKTESKIRISFINHL